MKKGWKIFNWIVSIFCILGAITGGFHFSSLLFLIVGVASLPVAPVQTQWQKVLHGKRWLKNTILVLAFLFACIISPEDATKQDGASGEGRSIADVKIETMTETEKDQETVESETKEKILAVEKQVKKKTELERVSTEEGASEEQESTSQEEKDTETSTEIKEDTREKNTVSHEEKTTVARAIVPETETVPVAEPTPAAEPAPEPAAPAPVVEAEPAPEPAAPAPVVETAPAAEPAPVVEAAPATEPVRVAEPAPAVEQPSVTGGGYAVNAKNGKIHMVGECSATKGGKNAMTEPVYFNTYEEAESYSASIAPNLDQRKCGNCWKN